MSFPAPLPISLPPCSISFLLGLNLFQKCAVWCSRVFLVSEEQLQLPCQIPQRSKGPVHCLRGSLIPLEAPVSTPVKVGAHQPLNSNEHRPRQDQDNNENSILVNSQLATLTEKLRFLLKLWRKCSYYGCLTSTTVHCLRKLNLIWLIWHITPPKHSNCL